MQRIYSLRIGPPDSKLTHSRNPSNIGLCFIWNARQKGVLLSLRDSLWTSIYAMTTHAYKLGKTCDSTVERSLGVDVEFSVKGNIFWGKYVEKSLSWKNETWTDEEELQSTSLVTPDFSWLLFGKPELSVYWSRDHDPRATRRWEKEALKLEFRL